MKSILSLIIVALFSVSSMAEVQVTMKTSMGTIELELDDKKAPITVANFVQYAESGYYNGLIFHRIIPRFMVQGGGFNPNMEQAPTEKAIQNEGENGLSNLRGTIAMARTNNPHSATSQFFINSVDNLFLDTNMDAGKWGYAVFGKVVKGLDIIDAMSSVSTGRKGPFSDVPLEPILIKSVAIKK